MAMAVYRLHLLIPFAIPLEGAVEDGDLSRWQKSRAIHSTEKNPGNPLRGI